MKKKINIFIIIILLFSIFAQVVRADTGWDGDYGGGGYSDYGGGWDNDYDYDYGGGSYGGGIYHGGGNHGGTYHGGGNYDGKNISTDGIPGFIIALIVILIVICFLGYVKEWIDYRPFPTPIPITTPMYKIMTEDEIKSVLPDFNMETFKSTAFEIYKNLQIAWMDFDYDTLRKFTTDELYNMYHSQLVALSVKKQKNIMKDFTLDGMDIIGMEHNEKSISLKVRATIRCYDYVVDENMNVVRGNSVSKVTYNYHMTFVKGLGNKDNKCPNCNAPLDNNRSSVCPYCGSTIISDNHDWVLSKKEIKGQTVNKNL